MRASLALLTVAMLAAPASAAPQSTIDELEMTRNASTITAQGKTTLADASSAVVGTDPAGDAFQAGIGADVIEASIVPSGTSMLRFTLKIADPLPAPLFTLPEITHYHWQIQVTNGALSIHYLLQAMRTGQYERTLPSGDPLFRVNSCAALASGAPNCFEVAGYVTGTMAGGVVQWNVPRALIGAYDGAVVAPGPNGLKVQPGASGAAYGGQNLDVATAAPYIVGPSVAAGIRYADDDPAITVYASRASLGPDGTFAAKLPVPAAAGDYVLSVRACHGLASTCAVREVPFTVA